ncbi:MAG: superoxide dismutase [Nanoarchaeota archaeon]|nr:superoxide dismutase [Nanoarchaeota archaeon]
MVTFQKDTLEYEYSVLEPYIDKETMQIHYEKHHQAYCDKLNAALESIDKDPQTLEEIFETISEYPTGVRNNAGGVWNHNFFWKSMCENGSTLSDEFKSKLEESFGSIEKFEEEFTQKALNQFGSGWAWLIKLEDGSLQITSTANQDNPLMRDVVEISGTPLLGVDVWEHAYYLKYQNKRPDYVKAFFNVVNWEEVERRYNK